MQPQDSESAFTDNDGLAAKLALQLRADLVVLMTDVDGVFTGPPKNPDSKLIDVWCPKMHADMIKIGEKSMHGRGGMAAKIEAAWMGAQDGATVVIMNGKYPENLVRLIDGEKVLIPPLPRPHPARCSIGADTVQTSRLVSVLAAC